MRQISADDGRVTAKVEGDIEDVDGVLRIARIRVDYRLRIPAGKAEPAQRAVDTHAEKCPAYNSVRGCIPVVITADVTEE